MRLMYLDKTAINDLKMNFSTYKNHFSDDTNSWFIEKFNSEGWLHESKIQCEDFQFNYDEDFNVSDRKNIEIIYGSLKELKPANALDERLWAGMLFTQQWEYVKYRRSAEIKSGNEKDILNSFLFMRGTKRSCFVNCLSRLWWTGFLFYDFADKNHYSSIDLICESAYASTILLISSNNFISNKILALGMMDCLQERKKRGDKIGRYHYVEANRYLNSIGGIALLDTMTREEVKLLVESKLNKLFGTL